MTLVMALAMILAVATTHAMNHATVILGHPLVAALLTVQVREDTATLVRPAETVATDAHLHVNTVDVEPSVLHPNAAELLSDQNVIEELDLLLPLCLKRNGTEEPYL